LYVGVHQPSRRWSPSSRASSRLAHRLEICSAANARARCEMQSGRRGLPSAPRRAGRCRASGAPARTGRRSRFAISHTIACRTRRVRLLSSTSVREGVMASASMCSPAFPDDDASSVSRIRPCRARRLSCRDSRRRLVGQRGLNRIRAGPDARLIDELRGLERRGVERTTLRIIRRSPEQREGQSRPITAAPEERLLSGGSRSMRRRGRPGRSARAESCRVFPEPICPDAREGVGLDQVRTLSSRKNGFPRCARPAVASATVVRRREKRITGPSRFRAAADRSGSAGSRLLVHRADTPADRSRRDTGARKLSTRPSRTACVSPRPLRSSTTTSKG